MIRIIWTTYPISRFQAAYISARKKHGAFHGGPLKKKLFAPGGVHLVRTSHVLIDLGERSQDVQVEDQDGSRDQDLATVETWEY